jgi:hypothetical protein
MAKDVLHLEPDEHIILEVRKHWIVFATYALSLLFSAALPFILYTLIKVFIPTIISFSIPGNDSALYLFFYTLWLLTLWIFFFVDWTKYYLDVWYVTEKRIIAVDQRNIFDRGISNLRFDKIQDVTIDVRGFIPTFLDFGNIKVQTASEDNYDFSMNTVRNPEQVRRVIFNQHNEMADKKTIL